MPAGRAFRGKGAVKRAAVFDIGSVSVKMLAAEGRPGGGFTPLLERSRVTRLAEGLAGRKEFLPEAVERTLDAVVEFSAEASALGVTEMEALGTEALRRVSNPGDFARKLFYRTGIPLEIIGPEREACLAFLSAGLLLPDREGPLCILDVGGGSTEILSGRKGAFGSRALLPIGALRLKEACIPVDPPGEAEISLMRETVSKLVQRHFTGISCTRLVGMGGTVMVLASIQAGGPFEPERLHGSWLTRDAVESLIVRLRGLPREGRMQIPGLPADREDLALPGAVIVEGVLKALGLPGLLASAWGIRHGRMAERFGPAEERENPCRPHSG